MRTVLAALSWVVAIVGGLVTWGFMIYLGVSNFVDGVTASPTDGSQIAWGVVLALLAEIAAGVVILIFGAIAAAISVSGSTPPHKKLANRRNKLSA